MLGFQLAGDCIRFFAFDAGEVVGGLPGFLGGFVRGDKMGRDR